MESIGLIFLALIALPISILLLLVAVMVAVPAFLLASPFWVAAFMTGNMAIGWWATAIAAGLLLLGGNNG